MTEKQLREAYELQENIKEAKVFISACKNNWKALRLFPVKNRLIHAKTAYGSINRDYIVPVEVADAFIDVLEKQIAKWQEELDKM